MPVSYRGAFGGTNWAAGWTKFSTSGILQGPGEGGAPPFADADSDGVSDDLEAANTDLGFNPAVNDAASVLGSVYTAAQVQADPAAFGLYNENSILNLTTVGQTMVQATGSNVNLSLPVSKSDTLAPGSWLPAGNMTLTIPKEGDKQFYRLTIEGAE